MALQSTGTPRFPFRRIAVTVPPADWFHGISRALFDIYSGELAALGLEIFEVPVDAFLPPDVVRINRLMSDLKAFQPELAFGLHRGAYALLCRFPAGRDGWRPNLFTEILDIPTVCLWDHAPLELADQLLAPHPAGPGESESGALQKLRRALTHPRLMHWSPDTGQTLIMQDLGLALPGHVIDESMPTLPGFHLQSGAPALSTVAFVGHFYQDLSGYPDPALQSLADGTIQSWVLSTTRPLWHVLSDRTAGLEPELRERLALLPDQSYFWRFAHRLALHDAQTALRLHVLGLAGVPVTCYGNLNTELPGVPRNLIPAPGHIPYGPELAACLARHAITIDVFNPGYVNGYSHKPMITFSSGGFLLVNRKRDFVAAFGEAGEEASYDSGNLADKIDHFLTNPARIRQVGDAIREIISTRFQLRDVLARVLEVAFERASGSSGGSPAVAPPESIVTANLLPTLRTDSTGVEARIQHLNGTALVIAYQPWWYAAAIRIPKSVRKMREPHLRLKIVVEAGRMGVAALLDSGALMGEQHASVTQHPIDFTIELPRHGAPQVILRSSTPDVSRAVVLEAALCDRAPRPK